VRDSIYRPNAGSSAGYVDLDVRWQPIEALLVTAQAGYTRGTGHTPHDYGYEAYLVNAGLVYTIHGTAGPADVSFPGMDPTKFNDPNHVVNGGSWSDSVFVTDEETYGQADATWTLDAGPLKNVKFGLRYAEHKRTDTQANYGCSLDPNNACYTNPQVALPMPAWHGTVSPSNFGQGLGVGPGFLAHFWVLDPNDIAAWEQAYNSVSLGPNYQGEFTVDEKDAAGYVMANFGWERLSGDLGLRLVNTDQLSSSFNIIDAAGDFAPASAKHNYTDVLPSLNLKYDITKDLVARFAVSKTLSRADYSSLSPAVTLNNLDHTGSGGDADLKPVRSTNYDLGLEWYFKPQSIASVGLFYMDMPTYVAFGSSYRPYVDTSLNQVRQFLITSPINVAAHEEGVELSWQQPLIWGFGALANYTYAEGKTSQGLALVGSSKSTANAEFYYEDKKLSARIAYTYRSSFLVGLSNVTPQYEASMGTLAASLNYKITDHVSLEFEGLNLNNPVLKYYSNAEQPQAFYSNGRQFFIGLRMSL
jgi:iron complex outermembrane receptor protein